MSKFYTERNGMYYLFAVLFLLVVTAVAASTATFSKLSPEFQQALDDAILSDDWLLHCAFNAEKYAGSFDSWWRISKFSDGVQERFRASRPDDPVPSKEEIGERVRVLRLTNRVDAVHGQLVRRPADYQEPDKRSLPFTPGPWESDGEIVPWHSGEFPGIRVAYKSTPNMSEAICIVGEDHASPYANARLIAAAPELYEALKALVESPNAKQNAMWDAARAALAKVEGE